MKINTKLFTAVLTTNIAVLSVMAWVLSSGFEKGFSDYLQQEQKQYLKPLVSSLKETYLENSSWEDLRHNPRQWHQLLLENLPGARRNRAPEKFSFDDRPRHPPPHLRQPGQDHRSPPHRRPPGQNHRPPPPMKHAPPPSDAFGFAPRLSVLDLDKEKIIGPNANSETALLLPVNIENDTVGWLTMASIDLPIDQYAIQFREQQRLKMYWILVLAIMVSGLAAWMLTRMFLQPINALTQGTAKLSSGDFSTQIDIQTNDELGKLAHDFNQLSNTLKQNEQMRQKWIADISHELRTPLTILRGEIEALTDGIRQADKRSLKSLHSEVIALNKLVDDLYELALSDIGALNYRKNDIDIITILDDVISCFSQRFESQHITLEKHWEAEAPILVFADENRLTQLFNNLLSNSLRYTDSGGVLKISTSLIDRNLLLVFEDSAPGVSRDEAKLLFERFYRVENSRNRKTGGAGLGLSISRNLVEAHDGRINATASTLGGLMIKILLPLSLSKGQA